MAEEVASMEKSTAANASNAKFKIASAGAIAAAMQYAKGEISAADAAFQKMDELELKNFGRVLDENKSKVETWSRAILHPIATIQNYLRGGSLEENLADVPPRSQAS